MRPAAEALRRWREHPDIFVRERFGITPDIWQDEALQAFPCSPRIAMKACKGPGKTAVLAWLCWNFLLTRPHARIGATSISGDNLKANLWTELARWREADPLLKELFELTQTEIYAREHRETWRLEARRWAQDATPHQIGTALAGLHAPFVMWVLDESGGYPEAILPTCEAIFAGSPTEAHIVQAGNPLQRSGPLFHACSIARRLWRVIEITGDPDDPRRSPRIPVEYAREQIRQYGRDNPWVMAGILGQFPPSAINSLLGPDDITAATRRSYHEHDIAHAARLLGIDVARFGDDASVMFPRQGLVAFAPTVWRNLTGPQGAGAVSRRWGDWDADACFVDDTGGYGAAWIDALHQLGRAPLAVHFAAKPHDQRYFNKRAEMYFEAAEWVKSGGQLPECPELAAAMTQITYSFKGDRLLLEDKDQLKARLGFSPDHADALALTFAEPILPRSKTLGRPHYRSDYDPFARPQELYH